METTIVMVVFYQPGAAAEKIVQTSRIKRWFLVTSQVELYTAWMELETPDKSRAAFAWILNPEETMISSNSSDVEFITLLRSAIEHGEITWLPDGNLGYVKALSLLPPGTLVVIFEGQIEGEPQNRVCTSVNGIKFAQARSERQGDFEPVIFVAEPISVLVLHRELEEEFFLPGERGRAFRQAVEDLVQAGKARRLANSDEAISLF